MPLHADSETASDAPAASSADAAQQALQQAMQAHGAGRLDTARGLYQQLLAADPRHPDALHLLGVLEAQQGRLERAAELIGEAIASRPDEAMFHNNMGNVQIERGQAAEAEASYVRAIALDPARLDALNNLGVLLGRRGDAAGAERLLQRVLELAPDFVDARQNLANHLLRAGRPLDAVRQCVDGLVTAPRSTALRRMLGAAYSTLGMSEAAADVYRQWLAQEPGDPVALHQLQAIVGEQVPERASDAYVSRVFDSFAGSFDAKLSDLSYQAPQHVAEAVARHAGAPGRSLAVLDAGCGTGLCGPLLQPWAAQLTGVDLSEGMLRKAVSRAVYDELLHGELVAFLRMRPAAWDLVASADTLCYFGALEDFAAAAHAALRGPGLLVFTVEAHADTDGEPAYRLQQHGRYSHRRSYVEAALRGAGMQPLELLSVLLRMEAGAPVQGWLVSARRAG